MLKIRPKNEYGSEVVQFIMGLFFLMLFLFFIIDGGRMVYIYTSLGATSQTVLRTIEAKPELIKQQAEIDKIAAKVFTIDPTKVTTKVTTGSIEKETYSHHFYNRRSKGYDTRESNVSTTPLNVTVTYKDKFLTPLGAVIAAGMGSPNGIFTFQTQINGTIDTTVESGEW